MTNLPSTTYDNAASKFVMEALDLGWSVRKLHNQYEIWNIDTNSEEATRVPQFDGATNVKTFTVDVPSMGE